MDEDEDNTPDSDEDDDAAIIAQAQALYTRDKDHWEEIYDAAKDDLDFLSDDPAAQWPDQEYKDRFDSGRPALTIDYLTQFVHQVANNIRMNTPSINPIPAGDGSSIETAKMLKGLIRKIEYNSCADAAYDNAATQAVKCSIGYCRVDHDYINDDSDDQELKILRVMNQFLIYPDSDSIESDGRDYNHANCLETIKVKEFRKQYPDAEVSSFDRNDGSQKTVWNDDDDITLSQFFIKETTGTDRVSEDKKGRKVKRTKTKTVIHRYKLSGTEVLQKTTFPGNYIPVIPFYGEEAWNNGKRRLHSLIRKSKPAQYMFNLMQSVEAEILLKQPIAPIMTPAGLIENYADDWKNPSKSMALRYDTTDANGDPITAKPERLMPPQVPSGMVQASQEAINNIKATMGLYNNAIGEQGQEVSGKAINARKIQGDVATYHFGDNAVRSITQVGRVIVSARKEVYDTKRKLHIINDEDKSQEVGINGEKVDGQEHDHDLTTGDYDVRVITGASFTTKRQESASFYQDLIKTSPEMMNIAGDLLFENMDIEGAQQMAARMKKVIPPNILAADDGKEVNPQVEALTKQLQQAQTIIQQGAQALQAMEQKLKDKTGLEQGKLQNESQKNSVSQMEVTLKGQQQKMDMLIKLMQLSINDRKNDITEQNNAGNIALGAAGQNFDQIMQIINGLTASLPDDQSQLPPGNASANNGGAIQGDTTNV